MSITPDMRDDRNYQDAKDAAKNSVVYNPAKDDFSHNFNNQYSANASLGFGSNYSNALQPKYSTIRSATFDPNAGKQAAYDKRKNAYLQQLSHQNKKVNLKDALNYYDKQFETDWTNETNQRKLAFEANQAEASKNAFWDLARNYEDNLIKDKEQLGYTYNPADNSWAKPAAANNSGIKPAGNPRNFNESHWLNKAKNAGFNSIDEVRNFQKEYNQFYKNKSGFIPLKEDGLFGNKSASALRQLTNDRRIEAEQKAQATLNDPFAWAKSQGLKGYTANGRDYYYHPQFGRIFADGKVYNPNTKQLGKFNAGEVTWNQKQFNLDNFSRRFGDGTLIRRNNKRYFRYDPDGAGDYLVGEDGKIYEAGVHGVPGEIVTDATTSRARRALKDLQNKIQTSYMQQGGKMNNQEEMQKAFMAFLIQDAAQQGMQIQSEQDLQAYAEQLGEDGLKAKYQEFMQKMQGQTPAAKYGAKLNYLKQLKGECPEGYEVTYFKEGGMFRKGCKICEAKKAILEKGGDVKKKRNAIEEFKKGCKMKK